MTCVCGHEQPSHGALPESAIDQAVAKDAPGYRFGNIRLYAYGHCVWCPCEKFRKAEDIAEE